MDNEEKAKRLNKEIKLLEQKTAEKKKMKELFVKRNKLKFPRFYSAKTLLKRAGENIGKWASKKNKMEKEKELKPKEEDKDKCSEQKKEPAVDVYDALFGETPQQKELNNKLGCDTW